VLAAERILFVETDLRDDAQIARFVGASVERCDGLPGHPCLLVRRRRLSVLAGDRLESYDVNVAGAVMVAKAVRPCLEPWMRRTFYRYWRGYAQWVVSKSGRNAGTYSRRRQAQASWFL